MDKRGQVHFLKVMTNLAMKDILDKIAFLKSALDKYRPFPEHVVRQ
jgi:hypothetical protein